MAEGHEIKRITKFDKSVTTGTVVGSLAATIQELADIDSFFPTLKKTLRRPTLTNIPRLIKSLAQTLPVIRKMLVRRYIKNKLVSDIYDPDDPNAMAGILFPLAIYAKYGKINSDLLISSVQKNYKEKR